jgi:hypothetical protein
VFGYFGYWYPAAVIAWVIAAFALVIWSAVCCWPCMRRPLTCCTFLKWNVLAHALTLLVFAGIAGGGTGAANPVVWWIVSLGGLLWEGLHIAAGCGVMPVELDRRTWPGCTCE